MSLYDLIGIIAIGGGVGVSYGMSVPHGTIRWFSLIVGALIGVFAFVGCGRLMARFESERAFAIMYAVTFIGTLAATILGAWLVRVGAGA